MSRERDEQSNSSRPTAADLRAAAARARRLAQEICDLPAMANLTAFAAEMEARAAALEPSAQTVNEAVAVPWSDPDVGKS